MCAVVLSQMSLAVSNIEILGALVISEPSSVAPAPLTISRVGVGRRPPFQQNHVGGIFTIKQHVNTQTSLKCSGPGKDVS